MEIGKRNKNIIKKAAGAVLTAGLCVALANISIISANAETLTTTDGSSVTYTADNITYTGKSGAGTSNPSSTYNEGGQEGTPAEPGERYNQATTTNPFLMPGNTWVTPEAVQGQDCILVLPVVNMFKYNIKDVIVTPRLGAKTDDFPFEISNTGYTQKIDVMVGEDAQPNYNDRIRNCVWVFRTRDNVKTGYYKIDFDITYTDPTCAVDTTVISVFVHCTGLPENGTVDGDEDKKLSMPRLIVTGFTTEPQEVFSGEHFTLKLSIENTSKDTTVKNLQFDLTATVEGSQTQPSYAAFLPTSGSNSFYIDSISPGGVTDLSMDFEAKSGLEQRPYVMSIVMKYEDELANAYDSTASVTIPVKQISKFDISTPTCEPAAIDIGEQSDLIFSIYNTGKTTLYNVQVTVTDKTIQPALAYVGNLAPGATGNVDVMLTGVAYSESDTATVPIVISYEDETGVVSTQSRNVDLAVQQGYVEDFGGTEETTEEETGFTLKGWQIALIGVGVLVVLGGIIAGIKALIGRKKRREEDALASEIDDLVKPAEDVTITTVTAAPAETSEPAATAPSKENDK